MDSPALHFSPVSGWMNDPNGLVWHDGQYHLYYQSDPTGQRVIHGGAGANIGWGHATSPDLVHWTHHPMALDFVAEADRMCARYSGSAVTDHRNVSGLGTAECPAPLLAFYTNLEFEKHDGEWQPIRQPVHMAYSLDGGRRFTPWAGNPVVPKNERKFGDPKVLWHEASQRWIMVNILGMSDGCIEFYGSDDLLDWRFLSTFRGPYPGRWECPDLFPLTTPSERELWILKFNAPRNYVLGEFDGERYTPHGDLPCPNAGPLYAEVTFNGVPDGRRLLMGWLHEAPDPKRPWVGMQSIPRELSLTETADGPCLVQQPAREILALRQEGREVARQAELVGEAWEIRLPEGNGDLALILDDGSRIAMSGTDGSPCQVLLDHRVAETSAAGGLHVTTQILPHGNRPMELTWSGTTPLVLSQLAV
jgi:sucrose-6-phosphate hydrolase SacC (GH32 family)